MIRAPLHCVLMIALTAPIVPAQTERASGSRASDPLHELSASLEVLARTASRGVVQIFSTGYTLSDEGESGNAGMLARQRSSGTGVILTADGYIVTNGHVVQGSRRIQVQLSELLDRAPGHSVIHPAGQKLDAKVVGVDRESDLALIKIEKTGLTFLRFGDSEELRQGQLVLAFGNPLGLENSVSMGVVSSMARQIKPDDPMIYIQTDAPINPGNSGGPLLDSDGRVVGINTFIMSQSGGSEGIGFAIPSNIVRNVVGQLRKDGHVHRGHIGIRAQTITPGLAAGLGLKRDWGVLLADVTPVGPSDQAGLEVGDVVLTLNGKVMENARQFEVNLYRQPIGQKVTIGILRGDRQMNIEVPVIERLDDPSRFADLGDPDHNVIPKLGIVGIDINQKIAEMLPDLRKKYGVVVAARAPGAAYSGASLNPGDVIYAINGTASTTVAALRNALDKLKADDPAVLQIEREGRLLFLDLYPE